MSETIDAKRALDIAVSAILLVVTWPLLVALAVMVRLDSRGPVIFRQERVGLGGERFRIHKFRSMRDHPPPGPLVSATGDPRLTRVGGFLRRSKLDELPQLVDVFLGHMSLVGPRPEVPEFVALWSPADRETILSVRPGLTDPASVVLRHEADVLAAMPDPAAHYVDVLLPRKTAMYVQYVANRTLWGDLRIILDTLRVVINHS